MATPADLIAKARSYIGTTENPPGSNMNTFAPIAGHLNGYAWCASAIVAWCRQVGIRLPSESAWTPSMAEGFKRAGRWFQNPQPGDIGFVDFPGDNTTGIQHVLLVTAVNPDGKTIASVEGNTSSGVDGSQDNGGGVFERVRPRAWIVGYGRPAYDEPVAVAVQSDQEAEMGAVVVRPQGGYVVVEHDGGVFAYSGAPFKGSIPSLTPKVKLGGNVVGGAWTSSGQGYWLVASDGAVYAFGDAVYRGGFNTLPSATRGGRYAMGLVPVGTGYSVVTRDPSNDGTPHDAYTFGA